MKDPLIGKTFIMQGKTWKVVTDGDNGWVGVECQDHNRAFTSEKVEDVIEMIRLTEETNK